MENINRGAVYIVKRFKYFRSRIFGTHEDYLFYTFYLPILRKLIKDNQIQTMQYKSIFTNKKDVFKRHYLFGILNRLEGKITSHRALIESVSYVENFLQELVEQVYKDKPEKLVNKEIETDPQREKIIQIIIKSNDKEEMLEKIIEEKVRGIFYGNPSDFFEKDKTKIGFNDYFKDNYKRAIAEYKEVIARRNILIHNDGRVDSKYLREITSSHYKINEIPMTDEAYIEKAIFLLHGLCTIVVQQTLKEVYQMNSLSKKYSKLVSFFEKEYKNK